VREVTRPFKRNAMIKAGPATPAAIPVNTKIPAPIIPPTPIIVTVNNLRSRLSVTSSVRSSSCVRISAKTIP
jgi:hypothetical protein